MLVPVALALFLAAAPHVAPPAVVSEADVDPPLARRTPAETRFLRARTALAAGDAAAAERELTGLATALPAISDRVEALSAAVAEAQGFPDRAIETWKRVPPTSLLWPQARMSLGRLQVAAGRPVDAVDAVRPLLGLQAPGDLSRGDPAPRALLFAGKVLADRPDGQEEARRLFLDCWAGHALSPEAKECRTRLDALPEPFGAPPGDDDLLRRAEALLDWNRNEQALAEARRLGERLPPPGPDAPLACRAAFVRGKALRKLRQHAAAAEELAPVVAACTDPALRPRALYLLAVTRSNVSNAVGVETYRQFAAEYPEHAQSDDALYFAADLLARDGRIDEARRVLDELVERYPDGDYRADALFKGAWLARRQGDLDAAVAGLARIESLYRDKDPYEHARAVYWRGRVLASRNGRGDVDRARAAWSEVAKLYPADYYGLLARARLVEAGKKTPEPRPSGTSRKGFKYRPGPLAADLHFRAAVKLLRLEMDREAADELNAVDRREIGASPEWPEPLLLLAELLDRAGDSRASHRLLRSQGRQVLREPPAGLGLRVWQMAYPPAWRDQVVRYAPPAGVPPDLLQALMREESALDPAVVSGAGAVGLTQLMVRTAGESAKKLALPAPSAHDLTDPRLNIRLGAQHLGELIKRFGGSAPLALAAYNAGEGNARAWWRSRASLPLDEFVEEIPIQETRGYVKRVLRSYAAYRMLYGRDGERPVRLVQPLPPPPP
jgi:soluble lytic murein transglycosylase